MTLVQLRHLLGLADAGTYAQAARLLCLSQPALSRSIQALEEELGGRLVDRLGRRVALTALGEQAVERARGLVAEADALRGLGASMAAGLAGRLRVGLSSAPGALLSVPMALSMAADHPRLHLDIARGNTAVLVQAVREQRLDAAVVDVRSVRPAADLQVSQVFELPAGFLVRPDHPLARVGEPVPFEALRAHPIASTPLSDEVARLLIERYGPAANPDDLVTLRSDETLTLVDTARRSDAIVLTVCAVAPDLVALPVQPALDASGRFGLVTLSRRAPAPALRLLRQQLPRWLAQAGAAVR